MVENLILTLVKDYNITIYCYKDSKAKTHIEGVEVIQFPEIKLGSLGVFMYYLICYCHIRFKGRYDIIHAHKIDSFFFLNGLSKKAKIVATVHGLPYKDGVWGALAKTFFKINERRFLNFKGKKTAISQPICTRYQERYGVNVKFIPNGVNLFEKRAESSLAGFWPATVPKESPFVFFAARRIMGIKGLHTMIEAYKKIHYEGNIFIAGDLDFNPAYIKQVKDMSEGLNLYFLGYVSPLHTLLEFVERCDYFVFPSEIEGMSVMLLEVASVGKPIVASDIPENTQVFNQDEVLYFKSKDSDELAERFIWLQNNREEFNALGTKAKEKVAAKYTWKSIALEYKSLYESLL